MKDLISKLNSHFSTRFGSSPEFYSQAPGRINIIGEHVDYTFGYSLPAAINRWTLSGWRAREDEKIRIYSANMESFWETNWQDLESSLDEGWKKYVGGALLLFKKSYLKNPKGFDLSILGNVPLGKGVSSSASIELSILNGLNRLYQTQAPPLELALMAQQVEHQYLNLKSGLLDQFASQFAKKDHALLIDFESRKTSDVKLSDGFKEFSWVIVDTMVKRELAGSKYSERVEECEQINNHLKTRGVENIRQVKMQDFEGLFEGVQEILVKRAHHIVSENERTLAALKFLSNDQIEEMGELLYESHASLALDYEVSHLNLDFLVEASQNIQGVAGGRMMGGGFGGCAIFLVANKSVYTFCNIIAFEYKRFAGIETEPLVFNFVDGASAFSLDN